MSLLAIRREGSALILTLDDPRRRNTLSAELCRALSAAVADAEADPAIKTLIVTGTAPAFCAGADLEDLKAAADGDTATLRLVYQSFLDVANCRLPTIAALNGPAVGAGLNLALACDIRIASVAATFDTRFLRIGLHPGGGHSWLLLRAVGWAEATRMLLLGESIDAQRAAAIGLVQDVVPAAGLLDGTLALAARADGLPRELIVETKATMRLAAQADHARTFQHETDAQLHSLSEPPFKALVARLQTALAKR